MGKCNEKIGESYACQRIKIEYQYNFQSKIFFQNRAHVLPRRSSLTTRYVLPIIVTAAASSARIIHDSTDQRRSSILVSAGATLQRLHTNITQEPAACMWTFERPTEVTMSPQLPALPSFLTSFLLRRGKGVR